MAYLIAILGKSAIINRIICEKRETARQEVILLCVEYADSPEMMSIVSRS